MQTILFPTDFSVVSYHAFAYLLRLYEQLPASQLVIYHACPSEESSSYLAAKDAIEKIKKEAQSMNIYVETFINVGNFISQIAEVITIFNPTIIFLGTRGQSGLRGALLGSNTMQLVKRYENVFWIIPEEAKASKITKILFAYDRKPLPDKEHSLGLLKQIAQHAQAEVRIAYVRPRHKSSSVEEKYEIAQVEKFLGEEVQHSTKKIYDNDVMHGLNYYINLKKDNNLLVMIPREHSFWERVLIPSHVEKIVSYPPLPLLILREK